MFDLNVVVLNFREAMKYEPLPRLIAKLAAAACLLSACSPTGAVVQTSIDQIDAISAHATLVAGGPLAVNAAVAATETAMAVLAAGYAAAATAGATLKHPPRLVPTRRQLLRQP